MIEVQRSADVKFWCDQIDVYEREFKDWETRSKKVVKRYKDERGKNEKSKAQFNILWSNVQTLQPALFAKNPVPNVDRRFQDDDKLGTMAARALERAITYFVDDDKFTDIMKQVTLDRLLPGRGTAWVRYEVQEQSELMTDDIDPAASVDYSEDVEVDYVHWQDFGHTWARTWQEVRAVWRIVYMERRKLIERFGEDIGKDIPLDYSMAKDGDQKGADADKRATVYEIWDKESKKVFWISKECGEVLDKRDDPLGLDDYFPCPKPVYATVANDSLVPTPDYLQYQDQAKELDELTGRIASITKSLKVAGVYDASAKGIQRLLNEGVENELIPVEQWAVFGDKGGFKGIMDFLPIEAAATVLISLYEAREKVKQDLYEITGISDIIRGSTNASETATAQQIKGQFATLRLDAMSGDIARFSRDLVRIMGEIIGEHFSVETIKNISGMKLMTDVEKQQAQLMQQQPGPDGQPQPLPEEVQEMLDLPTWDEVKGLLGDQTMRCFRIGIETDSTIKADQDAEKAARVEFLTAAGSFIQQAVAVPHPELYPLLMEMLMFGIRGFKVGRDMETTFEVALKKIKDAAENPQPPQPDPEDKKIQAQMQIEGQKLQAQQQTEGQRIQIEGQKAQGEASMKQAQMQLDAEKAQAEIAIKNRELDIKERELLIKERELGIKEQELAVKASVEAERIGMDKEAAGKGDENAKMKMRIESGSYIDPEFSKQFDAMKELEVSRESKMQQAMAGIVQIMSRPKKIKVVRSKDGKIEGAHIE